MSEFGGGSSEVSESTEVSETPPEETGGESSEATQEAATEEANESGGFDDAEDTEAPDSNEDTEDIDSEDDGDESQDVGFEDGEDVDNTDSQPDDAETYEDDNISDADEDQIGFDDSEETDEVDDNDIEDEDPEVDSAGNDADEDPDGSPDGDPGGDLEDDTVEDDLDADEDFDDEEDAGELEDYSDDSIDGDPEDDTVEDDQDVDDDGDIQGEEPEADLDGNEADEGPDGSPDGDPDDTVDGDQDVDDDADTQDEDPDADPDGDLEDDTIEDDQDIDDDFDEEDSGELEDYSDESEDDTVEDDQDVDDDSDIQDEDPEVDPDGNDADEALDGDPDGDPEDDTVEDDQDVDDDDDIQNEDPEVDPDGNEANEDPDDSPDGDPDGNPEGDTVEDDQNVDDDADIQDEDPKVDPDGNEADEHPDGDPEDDTIEDDQDIDDDFDDEEDTGELEDYSDDPENNVDSTDEADDEAERDQEEEELAEEKANAEAAEEAEDAVSEDANKLAEDEADPVEDENQKLLESQPEDSAENNESGDESNENEHMDDTPEEENESEEDIDSESEDDLTDELEDSEEYQDEGEPENYDDEKPVDPVSDTKDDQETPSETDTDDKVSKTTEDSEKEDAYRTAMNNMADYLNSHNYGREDYAEYSKDPEWQKLNADLQRSLGMEVTTDVPETSTPSPEGGKEVSSTELPDNCVVVNASDIDMTYAQGMDSDQFWNHHGNTKEDYMRVAEKLPDVQQALDSGKSIDELKNDPELGETVRAYYDPDNMIKVEQQPDGSYSFTDDGRHRIAAAQECGYQIPVEVTNMPEQANSSHATEAKPDTPKPLADASDGVGKPPEKTEVGQEKPPVENEFGGYSLNVADAKDDPSWVKASEIKERLHSIGESDTADKLDKAIDKVASGDNQASSELITSLKEAGSKLVESDDPKMVECGNSLLNMADEKTAALKEDKQDGSQFNGLKTEQSVEGTSEAPNPDDLNRKQDIGSETRENLGSFEQSKWDNLSQVEKEQAVEKLRDSIAEDLQLENKPNIAYYYKESPSDFGGYAASTNTIYINRFNMDNAGETADTIAHESRHCWQHERAENPQTAQDYRFKENFENYAKPELNFEAYYSQPVEQDAREYAAQIKDLIPLDEPTEATTQSVEGEAKPETKSENPRAPPEGEYQSKTVTELPADFEAKDVADNEVIKKVAPSIRGVDDFRSHMSSVYRDPGKTIEEKVEYEKKLFTQIPEGQKTNINAIDNPKAIRTDKESIDKGIEDGRLYIAFHDRHGLDETKPIDGIGTGKELPAVLCRIGPETGNNLTVPNEDGSVPSMDELSIPYAENPEAIHYYRTDEGGYYEAIDIISSVDESNLDEKTQEMNNLIDKMNAKYDLAKEHITKEDLRDFNKSYNKFQECDDTKQCRKDGNFNGVNDIDGSKYGVCGTVAPMYVNDNPDNEKLYTGGASQYNPPCPTKIFINIGVFREE